MTTRLALALALALLTGSGLWACVSGETRAAVEAAGAPGVTLVD